MLQSTQSQLIWIVLRCFNGDCTLQDTYLFKSVGVRPENHFVFTVRPRAKHERACLLVERKVFHIYRTRALVYRARNPHDVTGIVDENIRLELDLKLPVSAEKPKGNKLANLACAPLKGDATL